MAQTGDDCYFFYYQSCIKGAACPFRHVEEARPNEVTCEDWRRKQCHTVPCHFRHMELQKSTPCYYERQPGGCTKPNCPFQHKFAGKPRPQPSSKTSTVVTSGMEPLSGTAPPSMPSQTMPSHPPLTGAGPATWNQPPPGWPGAHVPPPQMYQRPSGPLGSGFPPFPPPSVPPLSKPPYFPPPIDPVIINPNDESSDQDSIKGSPMKHTSRMVVPTSIPTKSDNPLDYFLNAKPWVDPKERRSPSPVRSTLYRKQGSMSPDHITRRRSVSAERYSSNVRRRSNSLDRSNSPELHDRRRFGRRSSRSPPRRRSRSPVRDGRQRDRGLMNRFKLSTRPGPKLEEVKVTGSKIISIKKEDGGKSEESVDEKTKTKESEISTKEDEVKSLEEIYRERALMSMMEAKRKKILENKRKRWENLETARKSESDKSVNEKGDNPEQSNESSSDTNDDDAKSEIDLADDIDIELGEGELESDGEGKFKSDIDSTNESDHQSGPIKARSSKSSRNDASSQNKSKPSIKSRLGLKPSDDIKKQAPVKQVERNIQKRSIKDRLGLKSSIESDNSVKSGVIKLNRSSKAEDVLSRIRLNRKVGESKNILMLPQITIKNELDIEQRKAGIKQRLGLLDDDSKRDRKKKKSLDEELMKLLNDEGANISEDDLDLLSKKEKKKLLKKLLVQQGREDEYESLRRKKKKGFKKKKEMNDDDEDKETRRRIKLRDQSDVKEQSDDWDDDNEDIPSEEEICLDEEVEITEEETTKDTDNVETTERMRQTSEVTQDVRIPDVKSEEEKLREKAEKQAKLREALEPKSLEDIRKERALKRAQGGDASSSIGGNKRKIVLDVEPVNKLSDPPVRVTFNSEDSSTSRKLIRLDQSAEQNENDQPSRSNITRTSKQERRIYVPPTIKKLGGSGIPSVPSKRTGPPKGREIVDYGDMFPKKSTSAEEVTEKKKPVKLTVSASESDLKSIRRLGINKPQKVEVKNAEVKTFAEIMAEKKRKRQLAQHGKSFTPVTFDDSVTSSSQEKKTDSQERLSPVSSTVIKKSSSFASVTVSQNSVNLKKMASETNIEQTDTKPTRWKRRKMSNPDTTPSSSETVPSKPQESMNTVKSKSIAQIKTVPVSNSAVKTPPVTKPTQKSTVSPSIQQTKDAEIPSKEKRKTSDSILEFDDELLDIDDDDIDLDLGDDQDHDALMREMDELLS